jgi:hypothetical protein
MLLDIYPEKYPSPETLQDHTFKDIRERFFGSSGPETTRHGRLCGHVQERAV